MADVARGQKAFTGEALGTIRRPHLTRDLAVLQETILARAAPGLFAFRRQLRRHDGAALGCPAEIVGRHSPRRGSRTTGCGRSTAAYTRAATRTTQRPCAAVADVRGRGSSGAQVGAPARLRDTGRAGRRTRGIRRSLDANPLATLTTQQRAPGTSIGGTMAARGIGRVTRTTFLRVIAAVVSRCSGNELCRSPAGTRRNRTLAARARCRCPGAGVALGICSRTTTRNAQSERAEGHERGAAAKGKRRLDAKFHRITPGFPVPEQVSCPARPSSFSEDPAAPQANVVSRWHSWHTLKKGRNDTC